MRDAPAGELRSVRTSDGARLEYEVLGEGPPLVMLHGILASRFTFSRQRAAFARRFRLILLSARGHDGSGNLIPAQYGVGTSDVEDLRTVLDAERLDRVSLFGHSSGGATCFVFARNHPNRVDRAVLIEPTLLSLLPAAERAAVIPGFADIVAAAEAGGPEAGVRAIMALLAGAAWDRLAPDQQAQRLQALASCAPLAGPHMQGLIDLRVTEADILALHPPSLWLYGAASFPFDARMADRVRALRPDLSVLTIAGAGHNVPRDGSETVNQEALNFLTA